jgi:hypothetical protein
LVAIPLRDFSDAVALADGTRDCTLKVWVKNGEAIVATVPGKETDEFLDIARISACHLARVLTRLRAGVLGPLRQLLKETRRHYRRPSRTAANCNVEFIKEALCVLAVILQLADNGQFLVPRGARRWESKARLAGKRFPDTMRQAWHRYRELEGRANHP